MLCAPRRFGVGGAAARRWAAGHGADARHQFAEAERLGDVVVGAQLETEHAIELLGASGEHDDGCLGAGSQVAAHVAAVHVGQAEVEQHHVVLVGGEGAGTRWPRG